MIRAWRIVEQQYVTDAFSGEGARLFGGRWSSVGIAIVYTAENAALAALEVLANVRRMSSLPSYVITSCEFDERLVADVGDLPANWREYPAPAELQAIGDAWARSGQSAVLRVPSVLVPGENNYLLNPAHVKFKKIAIGKPERFVLDTRLMK